MMNCGGDAAGDGSVNQQHHLAVSGPVGHSFVEGNLLWTAD